MTPADIGLPIQQPQRLCLVSCRPVSPGVALYSSVALFVFIKIFNNTVSTPAHCFTEPHTTISVRLSDNEGKPRELTDSFGNIVTKTITVYVVDTAVEESPNKKYVRFISSRFYKDEDGNLLEPEKGGLELNSVWRENANYSSLLESVLSNMKVNEEYKEIKYFGTSTEIKVPGSGDWKTDKSTWVFTKDDIEEVKEFVDTYGYGNIRESNALELFIEAFKDCLKLN